MTVLAVKHLGKAYRHYRSEWQRIAGWFGLRVKPAEETWVVRDIDFSIRAGEAVGIVGQNGAGKSTLLKMITGTLQPTHGSIHVAGRIAAILELGMGFNPELTGRQNVYHSAGLMGFSTGQIHEAIDRIEAFAEIGEYFDQAVRTYSSGMQVRVAFAVASAFRPEVLIIDEALSVGDAYFQHKSFNRIREFQAQGTTLLIVSHDRAAIQQLCARAILLDKGRIIKDGNPEEVMNFYNALIAEKENNTIKAEQVADGRARIVSGTGEARVNAIGLFDVAGRPIEAVRVGQQVRMGVDITVNVDVPELVFGYMIKDRLGQSVFGTNTFHLKAPLTHLKAGETIRLNFDFVANIGVGSYSITTALHTGDTHLARNYEWRDLALLFSIVNVDAPVFEGTSWIPPRLECLR
ncbi:MAG: ABC transporter ATP-binding protein [Rhodocyclaceae bacterium]